MSDHENSASLGYLYECPRCSRILPWTDGVDHGGEEPAEYWCQNCGQATLIAQVAQIEFPADWPHSDHCTCGFCYTAARGGGR